MEALWILFDIVWLTGSAIIIIFLLLDLAVVDTYNSFSEGLINSEFMEDYLSITWYEFHPETPPLVRKSRIPTGRVILGARHSEYYGTIVEVTEGDLRFFADTPGGCSLDELDITSIKRQKKRKL